MLLREAAWAGGLLLLAAEAGAGSTSGARRPELLGLTLPLQRAGEHGAPIRLQDEAFPMLYLSALREGILNSTRRNIGRGITQELRFSSALEGAYTFFFTAAKGGLRYASEVLGLPLAPFLARSVDPSCNAFFMNGVVLRRNSPTGKQPWQDFAVTFHADQSLRDFARELPLPSGGTARTVVILYLSDVAAGGELEVYDHYALSEPEYRSATERASLGCLGRRGTAGARCRARLADHGLRNMTLGRLRPRTGRLVQFEGQLSHAVRRLRPPPATDEEEGEGHNAQEEVRVSLVLEQFAYPAEALRRIPSVWSEQRGQPFFASQRLHDRFVNDAGRPRVFEELVPEDSATP